MNYNRQEGRQGQYFQKKFEEVKQSLNGFKDWNGYQIIQFCKQFGEKLINEKTSSTQLRNMFSVFKNIQRKLSVTKENKTELLNNELELSKIQIMYNYKRQPKKVEQLCAIFLALVETTLPIINDNNIKTIFSEKFIKILEGLIAYGPKEEKDN